MASQAPHGSRTRYVRGCRCEDCKTANTEYSTKVRDRRKGLDGPALTAVGGKRGQGRPRLTVGAPGSEDERDPESAEYEPGPVESAVIIELQSLSASQKQPGLAESVRAMARLMDTPKLATTHTQAQHRLADGLERLRNASAGRSGKLASVALMSRREPDKTKSPDKTG